MTFPHPPTPPGAQQTAPNSAPNIIVFQADQLAAGALGAYGNQTVLSPHIDRLAADAVVFDRAYCNSPLCAPSRASMMTGLLPSQIGAYDNAAEFRSSVPTIAHHLRSLGYLTTLIGRMHFIGPDQLHGFDQRLTTDVYPADLSMVPDWNLPASERLNWYHDSGSVFTAGVSTATVQRDFDEEVTFRTMRFLTDQARRGPGQPFFLVSSFIHPHDPYEPPAEHWNRYNDVEIPLPAIGRLDDDELDPHSRRLLAMYELETEAPSDDEVRTARRAYYASVSYVDDQIGRIVDWLTELGLADNTVIVLTSDHGDMLGERGMWYKMSPFEASARVPLIVHAPSRFAPQRIDDPVSLINLLPTLVDVAGGDAAAIHSASPSLLPLFANQPSSILDELDTRQPSGSAVVIEYLAEGVHSPQLTLVRGQFKFVTCAGDPDQLFDLSSDPHELTNLAELPAFQELRASMRAELLADRDVKKLASDIRASQRDRSVVYRALSTGTPTQWDHEPTVGSAQAYVRGDFWGALQYGKIPGPAVENRLSVAPSAEPEVEQPSSPPAQETNSIAEAS